jgi:putative hydrolase of the HAD superfamily
MSKIKFIYFDIGDTLFSSRRVFPELEKFFKHSVRDINRTFLRWDNQACKGELSLQDLSEAYKTELKLEALGDINIMELWTDFAERIELMNELVLELSHTFRLGLLTNLYPTSMEIFKRKKLIPEINFELTIVSHELKLIKPQPELFKYAQEKTGLTLQEILFVDNSSDNTTTAEEMGWNTVLFSEDRLEESIKEIREKVSAE